jgi:hypothetical protein
VEFLIKTDEVSGAGTVVYRSAARKSKKSNNVQESRPCAWICRREGGSQWDSGEDREREEASERARKSENERALERKK